MYVTQASETNLIGINSWLADSATSSHICNDLDSFIEFTPLHKTLKGQIMKVVLHRMLYVPSVPNNLVSVTCLDATGGQVDMGNGHAKLYDQKGNLILFGQWHQLLYLL
ncbi:hypothetical protein ID866_12013, partial [Astraeus odoratus]